MVFSQSRTWKPVLQAELVTLTRTSLMLSAVAGAREHRGPSTAAEGGVATDACREGGELRVVAEQSEPEPVHAVVPSFSRRAMFVSLPVRSLSHSASAM